MTHVHCKTCQAVLILEAKSLDDQAAEFESSGWTEIVDGHGQPLAYCPKCSPKPTPKLPMMGDIV